MDPAFFIVVGEDAHFKHHFDHLHPCGTGVPKNWVRVVSKLYVEYITLH